MISYAPFWKTLKDRGQSTYTLINRYGISSSTVDRLRNGKGISTAKVDDLCKILDCRVEDIIEYVKEI
ncbi:MAG: helix-turn-helix transcriptional regulator [Clostridia bacterium]|nr:helix-turn-helix transcriptional regulator [Clostridia bacterium]